MLYTPCVRRACDTTFTVFGTFAISLFFIFVGFMTNNGTVTRLVLLLLKLLLNLLNFYTIYT